MWTTTLSSGHAMPLIGLGTWEAPRNAVRDAVSEAIRAGYRHVDGAPIYGNEAEVGAAIAASIDAGLVSRDELFVTSKLWNDAHAPGAVKPALEKTLHDLGLDHLDLYLVHWPVALRPGVGLPGKPSDFVPPDELPLVETWRAMEELVDAGLARSVGVSNFGLPKLRAVVEAARIRPAVNQVEMHPYLQQPGLFDYCREAHVVLTAYSPLGSPGRPDLFREEGAPVLLEEPAILEIAEETGATPAQVLIAWALQRGTAVIPKSTNPARIAENLAAADLVLPDEAMSRIADLDRGLRYLTGDIWVVEGGPFTLESLWDE